MSTSKKRWRISADRITLYPYRHLFTFGSLMALFFVGLLTAFRFLPGGPQFAEYITLCTLSLIVMLGFVLYGFTYIEFDRNTLRMRKMSFGFIPVLNVPFEKLYGIKLINRAGSGVLYRIVYQSDKFGKGVQVSSGYGHKDKRVAAFAEEVIPAVHAFLDAAGPLPTQEVVITEYKYFTWADDVFTVKVKKVTNTIVGLAMLAGGIWILYAAESMGPVKQYLVGGFCFVIGAMIIIGVYFGKTNFHTRTRVISRNAPAWLGGGEIPFDAIEDFHIVRHSTNGVYTHTAISLKYNRPNGKTGNMPITTVRDTREVERVVNELSSILKTGKLPAPFDALNN